MTDGKSELFKHLSREQLQAHIESNFGDLADQPFESPSEISFAYLVAVAEHVFLQYTSDLVVGGLGDDEGVAPTTLAGVPHGVAMLEGLRENLAMLYPNDCFSAGEWLDRF